MENKPLVIRHGACRDGFCASWVIDCALRAIGGEPEHFDGFYGQPPPLDLARNRDVVLVDFSYPRDQLLQLANACATMLVLDHHKTAEEALRGFVAPNGNVRIVFDMERSGAGLAWDNYFPGQERPMLVDYIEDRDLWRFALPDSKLVNAYLSTLPFDFDHWSAAHEALRHAVQDAQHAFSRASALLTDPSPENMGEALFHAALGMMKLAEADPERRAADRAEMIARTMSRLPE